jgi:F0F1-type ATP synthase assembly protein I
VLIPFLILGFTASFFSLTPIVKALTVDELRNHWINKKYFFLKPKDLTTEEQAHILNIHFYESLALSSEKTFEKEFKKKSKDEKDFNDLEMEMVSQILINSRIASLKYAFFKLASWLFVLGFIFSLIVLVVMNFIK